MEVQGRPGELIERLIALVDDEPAFASRWWANAGMLVATFVGGIEPLPRSDPSPPPESVGAEMRERHGDAPKDEYIRLLSARLIELIALGVSEAFLVRALRDELGRWFNAMADTGESDAKREAIRESMREVSTDPEALARYRDGLAKRNPEAAGWSDERVAETLTGMASSPLLNPTTAEAATDSWAAKDHFERRAKELLADADIERWTVVAIGWAD